MFLFVDILRVCACVFISKHTRLHTQERRTIFFILLMQYCHSCTTSQLRYIRVLFCMPVLFWLWIVNMLKMQKMTTSLIFACTFLCAPHSVVLYGSVCFLLRECMVCHCSYANSPVQGSACCSTNWKIRFISLQMPGYEYARMHVMSITNSLAAKDIPTFTGK